MAPPIDLRRGQRHYSVANPPPSLQEARERLAYIESRITEIDRKLSAGKEAFEKDWTANGKRGRVSWSYWQNAAAGAKEGFQREKRFLSKWISEENRKMPNQSPQEMTDYDPNNPLDLLDVAADLLGPLVAGNAYVRRLVKDIDAYLDRHDPDP